MKIAVLLPLLVAAALGHAAQVAAPTTFTGADKDGRIRTQLAARDSATISSELNAKIDRLTVRDGDSFKAGQTLVSFDCVLFVAQLRKAEASAEAARKLLDVNRRLAELNSVGKLEVEQAEAKVKESTAEAAYMRSTVSKCSIAAPFSGRVTKKLATSHEFVTPGKPLLEIVDSSALELQMIVPSKWLARIKPGTSFNVLVDELNQSYPAKVVRIGAKIDPVSQSISIVGKIDGNPPSLLPGMSGWASFSDK
ncbi:Toluene efflux pump periplasmic linker protein TtgG [Andreprevotia sp. IGB-42]|uniref:efflux RND transporter periplasmic adaptor subunit n=1 Tax=Andreprevotia sp. IGB-42 TaxID=2497473 RepID=UPI00135A05D7|nr:efflux RND transporter periplasmic adaptor subunit [Andreprevotia sp. IGB-42]KAF0812135.1 Toluene efflux pump periplasmic linker protein TtgG [Andreprevotia sp. IGB-42]